MERLTQARWGQRRPTSRLWNTPVWVGRGVLTAPGRACNDDAEIWMERLTPARWGQRRPTNIT
ncbi:MAG TPA: hypothetical protein VGF13_00730 [Verrucomicrobiae bacterium]|jgi:hypothetical protein